MHLLAREETGLRCLLQVALAGRWGDPVPIAQVAEAEGISSVYAAKLMRQLRLAGLVESTRGAAGGYRLTRPADAITVWDAIEVLGGSLFPESFCECHPGLQKDCVRGTDCALRALWRRVDDAVRGVLTGITLADLHRSEPDMVRWLDRTQPRASLSS